MQWVFTQMTSFLVHNLFMMLLMCDSNRRCPTHKTGDITFLPSIYQWSAQGPGYHFLMKSRGSGIGFRLQSLGLGKKSCFLYIKIEINRDENDKVRKTYASFFCYLSENQELHDNWGHHKFDPTRGTENSSSDRPRGRDWDERWCPQSCPGEGVVGHGQFESHIMFG